jgi:lipopolysaccharide biosynthesis protein
MATRRLRRLLKGVYWTATFQLVPRLRELRGRRDLRASGVFDEMFYLTTYPDVAQGGHDPIAHYLSHGRREGRLPNPLFDPVFYLEKCPDVAESGADPLLHFVRSGAAEGRWPHRWFDTGFYLRSNPVVAEMGMNPLAHYLEVGAATGRDPHPDFDTSWYLQTYPEVAAAGLNPLVHYVLWGADRGYRPGPRPPRANVPLAPPAPRRAPVRRERAPGAVPQIAVILHLFYVDLWEEILRYLDQLDEDFDLFVSLSPETGAGFDERIREEFPHADVRYFDNRGRDIGPFMMFLRDERLQHYELVCKIHSKKSPHRVDGDRWRGNLLHQLLGAPAIIREIRDVFEADPSVGLLGPANHLDRDEDSWGSNRQRMEQLARRMGVGSSDITLEFFAGSMFWFRPRAFARLLDLGIELEDFEAERGQLDGGLHHALERSFPIAVRAAGYEVHPFVRPSHAARAGTRVGERRIKLVAFYLPQFHPIPENDAWWGPGFTEWTNVTRARPLYQGHLQPRLPKDLGFYDLRVAETRRAQADLARRFGIHGFCYYYYWFDGRRLLERPLEEVVRSGAPDFPFCICWANENWTRRWDGLEEDVLVRQSYSLDSSRRFIRDVIPMLRDPRYLRYQGRPVLLVYRVREIPDLAETLDLWRRECAAEGVGPIHLAAVRFWDVVDVHSYGFDAAVDFPPHHLKVRNIADELPGLAPDFEGLIYDYRDAARRSLESRGHGYEKLAHRGVMLAWDNTPRRGKAAHIAHGATPEAYREWLQGVLEQEMEHNREPESLVFINAWNEWGESAALEPDHHFGMGFLEATREAMADVVKRWGGGDEP